ncbi:MAG: hypothetical protein ABFC90_09565 [Bacteroidales bacterium]|nr:hypothetical protein [Bacteroidales bacterium]
MKTKLLLNLAIVLTLLCGCSKVEETPTTYQIVNNTDILTTSFDTYLNGSLYEIVVFCYNSSDEVVRTDNLDPVSSGGGLSKKIEVTSDIVKVKFSFKMLPPESNYYDLSSNVRKYAVSVFYLTAGKNTLITIDGETMVKNTITSLNPGQAIKTLSNSF